MTVQHGEEGDSRATVLIPTINNPQELRVVLEHLLKDSDGTYDILVIDSSSNSETSDLCLELGVERIADSSLTRACLLYTSPSPRDGLLSRMPSSA